MSVLERVAAHLAYRMAQARRSQRVRHALERGGIDWLSRPTPFKVESRLLELCGAGGVFFEAGAADGYMESTTYYAERFGGCRGVLVEAVPEQYERCVRERPASSVFNCALVPPERSGEEIAMTYASLMSVVRGARDAHDEAGHIADARRYMAIEPYEFRVVGRTISEVLDESGFNEIDLMTLDLEGYEAEALRGLDLERHAPRYLMVEVIEPPVVWPLLASVLGDAYDAAGWLTPMDFLYVRRGEKPPELETRGALTWRPAT
jgi:FkbM family methyltransferase